ncbi:arginase family protein [Paractinoplanes maris]|uniref:arginase family protein n=1 Tax=Paractinoplanes maris TaxID=1734446 RepID=UPI0020211AE1|nr:arginase family protein [Actinoplanes maris]
MTTILVPYHANERLPDADLPVRADVSVDPDLSAGDAWDRLARLCGGTADAVAAADGTPVVFSGDCLIAGGTVAGLQRAGVDAAVVWLDAHGDVHTLETTTSGYLGGLSLRLVTGAHPDRYADRFGLRPVAPGRAVLADARDLDPAEADYLATSAIRRLTVPELSAATVPDGPLLLHVDVDVIDAADLPGLRFPVPHGPSADDVVAACERLVATGRVAALDVACTWAPPAGPAHARLISRLAALINP